MQDLEIARTNMIDCQLRTWDVFDEQVLESMRKIPRDHFVPAEYRHLAYADMQIPLAHEQVMMSPREEARMLQALDLQPDDMVLEIGTGTGYTAALFANLAGYVVSVDIFSEFTKYAKQRLAALKIKNALLLTGDAVAGWQSYAPYDVIAITGALSWLPKDLYQQLRLDGRIFAIVGEAPAMQAMVVTLVKPRRISKQVLFEMVIPKLLNAPPPPQFKF